MPLRSFRPWLMDLNASDCENPRVPLKNFAVLSIPSRYMVAARRPIVMARGVHNLPHASCVDLRRSPGHV
jgi:hypothetical protein